MSGQNRERFGRQLVACALRGRKGNRKVRRNLLQTMKTNSTSISYESVQSDLGIDCDCFKAWPTTFSFEWSIKMFAFLLAFVQIVKPEIA